MNVLIVEDEKLTAERIAEMINRYDNTINIIGLLTSIEQTCECLKERSESIDLIFLDIHLDDGDAFQIFEKVDVRNPIIFTTAFDDYMIKAFKVNSVDYLLKPIEYDDLSAAIDKFKSLRTFLSGRQGDIQDQSVRNLLSALGNRETKTYKDRFMTTIGSKIRIVKTEDIAFFFLERKAVLLMTFDGNVLPVDYSLDKLTQVVDPKHFFRTNRQFIVALNAIQIVHSYSVGKLKLDLKPKPKEDVFVSGDKVADFKEWLGK